MDAADHQEKIDRVRAIAREAGVDGVLLAAHHNIAWVTGGRNNRVDASREIGTSRLLIAADGRLFVLANAIEMPRMLGEVLAGFDYTPIEYPSVIKDEISRFLAGISGWGKDLSTTQSASTGPMASPSTTR